MHTFLLISIILIAEYGYSQSNLVINPSFEDTTDMTAGIVLYSFCNNWWSPNGFSSDYFSIHCEDLQDIFGTRCVPCSSLGCQDAQEGSAYAGLVIYENNNATKDYAQGFLTEPMAQDVEYCISVWIALADSSSFLSCDFQVAFTDTLLYDGQASSLFLENYVNFNLSGINSLEWTYFEGTYTAIGGEQFIYLGSNTPNSDITCVEELEQTWLNNASYILVDNVSVRENALCSSNVPDNPDKVHPSIFPNPVEGIALISNLGEALVSLKLYDGMGRYCHFAQTTDGNTSIDFESFDRGIYYLQIESEQNVKTLKIVKQ